MGKKTNRFGKSKKGTVIHIVIEKANRALCEKKQIGLVVDKALTIENVTCKRCMATPVFKKELSRFLLLKEIAKNEQMLKEEEEAKIAKESFYKKGQKNGTFKIIHKATKEVFFSQIEKEVIDIALKNLNEIEEKWASKHDQIPKGYIPKCRSALSLAYTTAKIPIPNVLKNDKGKDKKQEGKKRSIKRRDKEKPKKERRKKKEKTFSSLDFSILEMQKGITFNQLSKALIKKYNITEKKSFSICKRVIRKLRKQKTPITITTSHNKKDDLYKINKPD